MHDRAKILVQSSSDKAIKMSPGASTYANADRNADDDTEPMAINWNVGI